MWNAFNPYWGSPIIMPFGFTFNLNRCCLQRIDTSGIYVLNTNSVQLNTGVSVDYGVNPRLYNQLPCESIILLKIHAAIPTGGEALPVMLAVPNDSGSTTTNQTTGNSTINMKDSQNNNIVGDDIEATTERLAYLNKRTGTLRFLEFISSTN